MLLLKKKKNNNISIFLYKRNSVVFDLLHFYRVAEFKCSRLCTKYKQSKTFDKTILF